MTMSVGLARIITDPEASVLVRKALGALSTPGLLVYDDALTIDDTGRIVLRLHPDGGLSKSENGLAIDSVIDPPDTSILVGVGIDSHWDLPPDGEGRRWNARLTGTAPNYFESGLAIGSEEFTGISSSGVDLEDSKLCVTSKTAQLRLRYDSENFLAVRALSDGFAEFFSVGATTGFHFMSGDGTGFAENGYVGGLRVNHGSTVEQFIAIDGTFSFAGGGAPGSLSWEDVSVAISVISSAYNVRPDTDVVTVVPKNTASLPAQLMSWSARISNTNEVTVRISWFDAMAADSREWVILIHRMSA